MDVLGNQGQLLLRLLASSQERARVIASNISNQNTPGYKRRVHEFESLLTEELDRVGGDLSRVQPKTETDELSAARGDGNNVTVEREVTEMRETVLRYELYASLLRSRTNIIRSAIHGER